MKKIIIPALVAMALAGCQFIPGTEAHMIETAKKQVAASLKDPTSPLFTQIRAVEDGVCGQVNGKNSFGAYAGNSGFVWRKGGKVYLEDQSDDNPGLEASNACTYQALAEACHAGTKLLTASIQSHRRCSAEGMRVIETTYGLRAGSLTSE